MPVRAAGERSTGAAKHHVVRKGDTLYSVAFRYGLDYKLIAEANNIDPPYTIYLNQKLALAKTK
ncbi:MAG: LysM domain-containing protein, partial [Pseudomonadales bacterium]|nr:LysM domain-containing protein [Pseudomonadales bacterium]